MHTRELAKIYRESAARITKRLGELRAAMRAETDPEAQFRLYRRMVKLAEIRRQTAETAGELERHERRDRHG